MAYKQRSPLPVEESGTGIQTLTQYAPVCGGTTAQGALQSASTDQSNVGYALTSNGDSALPTWQSYSITRPPTTSSFYATADLQSNVTGNGTIYTVLWANVSDNTGSDFSSPVYTAPSTGMYMFSLELEVTATSLNTATIYSPVLEVTSGITPDATFLYVDGQMVEGTDTMHGTFSCLRYLEANDTVSATIVITGLGGDTATVTANSKFSGYFLGA